MTTQAKYQQFAVARMLNAWGMTMPTNPDQLDATLDRAVALKDHRPDDSRLDDLIRAIGVLICESTARELAAALH